MSDGIHRPGLRDGVVGPVLTTEEADEILRNHYTAAVTDPTRYRDVVLGATK